MSVNSAMKAVADKIRAILGISGTMGLDAMATNLGTVQTNVTNAFTAIGNKGGTVPSSRVSGNLASAINSIPSGVTVQRISGTFTTDSSGEAVVNCGFQPDLVFIHANEAESTTGLYNTAFAFAEEQRTEYDTLNCGLWKIVDEEETFFYDLFGVRTTNGFHVTVNAFTYIWESVTIVGKTFNYTAVKYT